MIEFVLYVYIGTAIQNNTQSFANVNDCKYFAERINNQPLVPSNDGKTKHKIVAVCLPRDKNKNMLDPITLSAAVSGATAAYNGIKKAIMLGKEIEDLSGELGRWMSAVSDVDNIHKNSNNPSTIDKLFNGSIEQVAIESFASKKKLQKQREELKNFFDCTLWSPSVGRPDT